ncbi:MAG: choice-of-anchor D domain-containing protein [Thiotrichales bacterium]
MKTGRMELQIVGRRRVFAASIGRALGTASAVLALTMIAGAASAESGCPTGFVPNGTENLVNSAFSNGYNGFTTDPVMYRAPVGTYPTDGAGDNTSGFPSTGIGVMTGNYTPGIVSQIAFPGDPSPPGGLPAVPAASHWLAFNGNDAGAPTKLWEQTITGLKANTDYAFTAYFSNALAAGQQATGFVAPLVEFRVDGTQVGSDIPVCDSGSGLNPATNACATEATADAWQRLGITVSTGGATSAVLSVHDKQVTSSSGNDFAMTLVSFQECVPIGTPDIAVTPTPLNFPAYTLGGAATSATVTVRNTATGALTIGTITAPANTDFTIVTDGCSGQSLTADQSCALTLNFSSATAGAKTGTLTIPSNDPDEPSVTVPLAATAAAAGGPALAVTSATSTTPITGAQLPDFTVGGTRTTTVITMSNVGTGSLALGNIPAPTNTDFTLVEDGCSGRTLTAQQSCTITLAFETATAGDKAGDLVIPSATPGVDSATIGLAGRAVAAPVGEVLTRLEGGLGGGAASLPLLLAMGGALALRRRRWLALAGLMGASFGAQAAPGQFYIGGGVGQSFLEPEVVNIPGLTVTDDNDVGYKLFLGYDILRWLSIEAFGSKLGAAGFSNGGEIDYKTYGAGLVANLPSNSPGLSFLAKLGFAEIDNKGRNINFREVESSELYGGLGAEYQFRNGVSVRGEYEYFDEDAQLVSLSLLKRFGGAKPKPAPVVVAAAPAAPVVKPEPPPPPKPAPVAPKMVMLEIESIFFDTDKHALKPEAVARLNEVVHLMNAYPDVRMTLVGHADERGSDDYNMGLSLRRAKEAAKYLEQQGVINKRLSYEARGEREPRDPRSTPEGWTQNRRVDFAPNPREVVENK